LRVLRAGRGHFSPDRSNLVMVMARYGRIAGCPSIAPSLVGALEPTPQNEASRTVVQSQASHVAAAYE
jgi:hypothetical protein